MTFTRIATGDALTVLRQLPSESVHACVTSPPYWRQRDYEVAGQIGWEASPDEYIARLLQVFDEVQRVLRPDGSCWVVLGDTYVGKCLTLIPGRFGSAMVAHSWICRNRIIWHKPNPIPASATDRFTVDHEEVYFFTKSARYFFKQQFVPYSPKTTDRLRRFVRNGERFDATRHKSYNRQGGMRILEHFAHKNLQVKGRSSHTMHKKRANGEGEPLLRPEGANMPAVWTIPVACCKEAHFAVYPKKLVEIAVLAGCPEGGIVIDPFSGAGTTGIVCERLGRSFLGIELSPEYVEIATRRIRDARNRPAPQARRTVTNDIPALPTPAAVDPTHAVDVPLALSFFSGAMGLDIGLEEAGFSVRLASETDEDARTTISLNRPSLPLIGDIMECSATQVRTAAGIGPAEIDLVAGGCPCQSFSTAGNRKALDDFRGKLLLKFACLAVELRARYVLIENVRGLLSAGKGRALEKVVGMLADDGYAVSFCLYNTAYFGVAQQRERLVIIGSRNGHRVPYLAPTHSDRLGDGLPPWRTLRDVVGDMANAEHHHVEFSEERQAFFKKLQAGQNWRHLSKEDQKAALSEAARGAAGGKTGFFRRLAWDKPCPTLVSRPDMPATDLCHPEELRPLSVEEYRRIQGFPDHWKLCGDLVSQYRQIGNAVPVLFGKAIGLTILEHMRTQRSDDPVPGFRYSRYAGTNDRDWAGARMRQKTRV